MKFKLNVYITLENDEHQIINLKTIKYFVHPNIGIETDIQ